MSSARLPISATLTPFLYPCLDSAWTPTFSRLRHVARCTPWRTFARPQTSQASAIDVNQYDHLDPAPADYSAAPFADACTLAVSAGGGGHGCISFLREKYISDGPPNGGDGGTGGGIYIQAVRGETSLHKLARRRAVKAGRGKNGQGSLKGGARGDDVLITVPVGTVIREISRIDPVEQEEHERIKTRRSQRGGEEGEDDADTASAGIQRDKWLIYPGTLPKSFSLAELPALPRARRNSLASLQPEAPVRIDLDKHMDTPMLLAAGAVGGLGNPHFMSKTAPRPKFATKGDEGVRINLQLELKLLADVGLVGLPNAGKSTLLRAITNSRTRIGNWAFTTLRPNIGTLVLDTYTGRPLLDTKGRRKEPRTHLTIADIPGLIEGAHLDRGLGLGFLRHIERAAVMAFVIDLSARNAVTALKDLWKEVGEYEKNREQELNAETQRLQPQEDGFVAFKPFESSISPDLDPESVDDALLDPPAGRVLPAIALPPISSKPWLVVATKADLPGTQENFQRLQSYLQAVESGDETHPSGKKNGWRKTLFSVPVSAINKEGVSSLPGILVNLLDT